MLLPHQQGASRDLCQDEVQIWCHIILYQDFLLLVLYIHIFFYIYINITFTFIFLSYFLKKLEVLGRPVHSALWSSSVNDKKKILNTPQRKVETCNAVVSTYIICKPGAQVAPPFPIMQLYVSLDKPLCHDFVMSCVETIQYSNSWKSLPDVSLLLS